MSGTLGLGAGTGDFWGVSQSCPLPAQPRPLGSGRRVRSQLVGGLDSQGRAPVAGGLSTGLASTVSVCVLRGVLCMPVSASVSVVLGIYGFI